MKNPWLKLPRVQPHILFQDLQLIRKSKSSPEKLGLRLEVLPVPYVGNLNEAKVVLLCLNPGFIQQDIEIYNNNKEFNKENLNILTFRSNPPFFYLNQKFKYTGGYRWWSKILKELLGDYGENNISRQLMCLQYIPYHSVTFINPPCILESQKFTFNLLKEAMRVKRVIVIMRSKKLWVKAVPELENYPYIELKNYRRPFISKGDMKEGDFERVISALQE